MAEGTGKTRIKEVKLELYIDEEVRAALRAIVDGRRDTLELNYVYFRHLLIEDLKHEGYKVSQVKIPVGRIVKLKVKAING
ncbi:hypothetical protein [Tumebacillus permanentifrigoris]|uniref:Uncharacterized protein n=1 Tax=Tumebacillus permanentifrigoris TaxID=378543 RepID=A0A316D7D9_9BACL|nr:hypothetical protein [Tumebacillus permanentifrigoris]PWK08988.1 hypothetical protein C7459_11454 [Tumebacillus permanentifrigoris]